MEILNQVYLVTYLDTSNIFQAFNLRNNSGWFDRLNQQLIYKKKTKIDNLLLTGEKQLVNFTDGSKLFIFNFLRYFFSFWCKREPTKQKHSFSSCSDPEYRVSHIAMSEEKRSIASARRSLKTKLPCHYRPSYQVVPRMLTYTNLQESDSTRLIGLKISDYIKCKICIELLARSASYEVR